MQIADKTALVTGGTDGIGLWTARLLKAKGASVIICGRNETRLAAAREEGLEAIRVDLSSAEGCRALVEALGNRPLDILVNNAGASEVSEIGANVDLDSIDHTFFLNLHAPVHLILLLLDRLRARPAATIVNVTSGLAIAPRGNGPFYCATKAGLRSFTQALRYQMRGSSVTVIEALPPLVDTAMTAGRGGNKMSAEDCARAIVTAIGRGQEEVCIGQTKMLKLVHSMSPALARRIMLRF
ncbi:SDR family oxidoreductase [Sphingomonas cavernae]|uniref:SDR family NAD(P)-dependent oxidoreductase n=1 Tax=Sphingomonas cavernae TaxID=2320861 RepID=A0A418W645_9SPHN|nr:SDR family NAD(P)-dependent oxidoreductase [Sphingomonas cavernae]RJF85459.1 SDR family NAD(P)-dependent oxidoreductase [Sphingomonas cavernae]